MSRGSTQPKYIRMGDKDMAYNVQDENRGRTDFMKRTTRFFLKKNTKLGREKKDSEAVPQFFDPDWYLARYPDVRAAGVDPLNHYLEFGKREGRAAYDHSNPPPEVGSSSSTYVVLQNKTQSSTSSESNASSQATSEERDYATVLGSGYFDPTWYFENYPDLDPAYMGALTHFMKHGAFESRSPGPKFDSDWYFAQNPDLRRGALNPLIHYILHGAKEGRKPHPPAGALEAARSTIDSIADLDPALLLPVFESNLKSLPIFDGLPKDLAWRALKVVASELNYLPDCIMFLPWLIHGGADLVAINIARAMSLRFDDSPLLLITLDHDRLDARDWLPSGVQLISIDQIIPGLSFSDKVRLVDLIVRAIKPASVINVNSHACWEAFRARGRVLAKHTKLYGAAFCRDYDHRGVAMGYIDSHLRESLVALTAVFTDNQAIITDISDQLALPSSLTEKFIVLRQPAPQLYVKPAQPAKQESKKEFFRILWAGRFCVQKNIKLLKQIIPQLPNGMHIDVWGRGNAEDEKDLEAFCSGHNRASYKGSYPSFTSLPLHEYDALLYTSLWDGVPNVLLEASASRLPIVAPNIGGISELVSSETGWLVDAVDSPHEFISCLVNIKNNDAERTKRLEAMSRLLRDSYSSASFSKSLASNLGYFGLENE